MKNRELITPQQVVELAFATGEYIAEGAITPLMITAAELRYIQPVAGSALLDALAEGNYPELLEEYVAPTLAVLTRIEANLEAYPPNKRLVSRGRLFLQTLSDHLNASTEEYEEYNPNMNAKNSCSILCGYAF